MFRSRRSARTVAILIIALVMASITYAFAAANTMPAGEIGVGEGQTIVSGYTIADVHFSVKAANPSEVDYVTFTATSATVGAPTVVRLQLAAGGSWYPCSWDAGNSNWKCDVSAANVTVTSVTLFHVVTVE